MERTRRITHPLELIRFDAHNCHLLLRLRHGGRNLRFVLDTGATANILERSVPGDWVCTPCGLEAFGINGPMNALEVTSVAGMRMGRYLLPPMPFIVGDMGSIVELYHRTVRRRIAGLIGGETLLEWGAAIDYSEMQLTVRIPPPSMHAGRGDGAASCEEC